MKLYVNVTNYCNTEHKTGIQRVVNGVVSNLLIEGISNEVEVVLLSQLDTSNFFIVTTEDFQERSLKSVKDSIDIEEFEEGSVYLELDATWHSDGIEELYQKLKIKNIMITILIHDVIPFFMPDFFIKNTVYGFILYIKNVLKYADLILVSTNKVKNDLNILSNVVGIEEKNIKKIKFGHDFNSIEDENDEQVDEFLELREDVSEVINKGNYLIMVGTIEPRKNHKVVVEAFEEALFSKGFNLVIVGKRGWNNENIISKIKSSKYLDKQLFWLEGIDDQELDLLYKNALFTIQASLDEGFGLPIIEAIVNEIPILASDIDTFREVTYDKAIYFDNHNSKELIDRVVEYSKEEKYNDILKNQGEIPLFTWKESSIDIINTIKNSIVNSPIVSEVSDSVISKVNLNEEIKKGVNQVLLLTNRIEVVNTFKFIENLMSFVDEVVIATPQKTVEKIRDNYFGTLKLTFITDEELLNGRELPADHAERNLLLRKLLVQRDEVDNNFIMYDDDYRPLKEVTESFFIENNKYNIYYFHDLNEWYPYSQEYTSFDLGMIRGLEFAKEHNTSTLQFDAHMPQIMNKSVWKEIIEEFPDANTSEWNLYFNHLNTYYKDFCNLEIFKTLAWPDNLGHWGEYYVEPEEFVFENFYGESYEEDGMFEGFTSVYTDTYLSETDEKIKLFQAHTEFYSYIKKAKEDYFSRYKANFGTLPPFALYISEKKTSLITPNYIENYSLKSLREKIGEPIKNISVVKVKVKFKLLNKVKETTKLTVTQVMYKGSKQVKVVELNSHLYPGMEYFSIPLHMPNISGKFKVQLLLQVEDNEEIAANEFGMIAY